LTLTFRYRQAVGEAFWEAPTLYAFSYIIIVLGCCMIVISFVGCCFGNGGNRAVLICYAIALFLLLIGTLSCGIYLFYKKDGEGVIFRIWVALSIGLSITLIVFSAVILCIVLALVFSLYLLFNPPKQVRVVSVPHKRVARPTLRREDIQRHNLAYDRRRN
ncbi:hypothetical protein COOONC_16662, partial [Cooperia oncophora]